MKIFRRAKKLPANSSSDNLALVPAGTPASSSSQDPRRFEELPRAFEAQEPAHRSRSPSTPRKALEQEVQALREQNDRLTREMNANDSSKASEKRQSDQQVQRLEKQVQDLKFQLAQRGDSTDESSSTGDTFQCLEQPLKMATSYVPLNSRSGKSAGSGVSRKMIVGACALLSVETALLLGVSVAYLTESRNTAPPPSHQPLRADERKAIEQKVLAKIPKLQSDLEQSMNQERYWEGRFTKDEEYWEMKLAKAKEQANLSHSPYELITGLTAHSVPEMYGKVKEKTIWAYWYHPETCKTSKECTLPPVVQLCSESIQRNKGSFDFKIVHMDEVEKYVNKIELPMKWQELLPAHQKDSLMNALLARYGGVAMDISTVLLRPLDDYWEEMVSHHATFMGYMYRLNGEPWRHAETTVVWFLMSRREGIFSTAVRNQVIGMGDRRETGAYHHWYLALGDQTITPILHMFNYSLPKCTNDPTITRPPGQRQWDQKEEMCPEHEMQWDEAMIGPARTDTKVILRDPRDGPQLPFAFGQGMGLWKIDDTRALTTEQLPLDNRAQGAPMQSEDCDSPKECWQEFMHRYSKEKPSGRGRLLNFVKLFAHAKELKGMSRQEILSNSNSFFVNWLRMAGVSS